MESWRAIKWEQRWSHQKKTPRSDNELKPYSSQLTYFNCGKKGHICVLSCIASGCTKPKVNTQSMHTHVAKHLLHVGFVAKASKTQTKAKLVIFPKGHWSM